MSQDCYLKPTEKSMIFKKTSTSGAIHVIIGIIVISVHFNRLHQLGELSELHCF